MSLRSSGRERDVQEHRDPRCHRRRARHVRTATPRARWKGPHEIATFSTLPRFAEAAPARRLGSLQNGSWVITSLPYAIDATGAIARSVNNQGDAVGNDFLGWTSQSVLWPATGGFNVLGCGDAVGPATVTGISAAAQTVVGQTRQPFGHIQLADIIERQRHTPALSPREWLILRELRVVTASDSLPGHSPNGPLQVRRCGATRGPDEP